MFSDILNMTPLTEVRLDWSAPYLPVRCLTSSTDSVIIFKYEVEQFQVPCTFQVQCDGSSPGARFLSTSNWSFQLLFKGSMADIILGHPWLLEHALLINWNTSEVRQWSKNCFANCIQTVKKTTFKSVKQKPSHSYRNVVVCSTSIESPNTSKQQEIPPDVFSKQLATKLPPHRGVSWQFLHFIIVYIDDILI